MKTLALKQKRMTRFAKYTIEEVLFKVSLEDEGKRSITKFDGHAVKMNSLRYKVFKKFGIKCVSCGIEGQFFAMEAHPKSTCFHFNLYALDVEGNEVLMTKDHIIPKKEGGKDVLENLQTMCTICNALKGKKDMQEITLNNWLVYLIRCNDDTQYCGCTNNLAIRLEKHNAGKACKYTRSKKRRPVILLATREGLTKRQAFRLESFVKKQNAQDKVNFLQTTKEHLEKKDATITTSKRL